MDGAIDCVEWTGHYKVKGKKKKGLSDNTKKIELNQNIKKNKLIIIFGYFYFNIKFSI